MAGTVESVIDVLTSVQNGGVLLAGEEPEDMGAKPTPVLLHPPQIPHAMSWKLISPYAMPG